jgi:hypothetical protein
MAKKGHASGVEKILINCWRYAFFAKVREEQLVRKT